MPISSNHQLLLEMEGKMIRAVRERDAYKDALTRIRAITPSPSVPTVIKYRCPGCGSSNIGCTANVYWHESGGYWKLEPGFEPENKCWCNECDLEFSSEIAEDAARKIQALP